ncbi:MAG: protein kinase [Planctomycetes bacterium]|nr:protein kinase [Planctomycetota bacterium]
MDTTTLRHVREVLEAVADAPLGDVPALLDKLCKDEQVRREVERALRELHADETFGGFMETSPVSGRSVESEPDVAGRRIGRYELVRVIGEGGMGTVYEARQESPRRHVALKVLKAGYFSPGALRRFERESAVLGMLHHSGIAQIFEAGVEVTPMGRVPFFAMELVHGSALDVYVRETRPSQETVLEIVARIADAVHHAHTHGVVHRDLKPGNILVEDAPTSGSGSRYGEGTGSGVHAAGPVPTILDFGVARVVNAEIGLGTTTQTQAGQIVGTLTYMSPEQVSAKYGPVGPRTDVYALGVILYELIAGSVPLDVRNRPLPEATNIIVNEEPPRLRRVSRRVHEDVETIVAKAMDKDPKRRYASAAELAMDLRRFLRKEPISARPSTTIYQLRRFAARNRTLVGGVCATLAALVLGLTGTVLFAQRESVQRRIAQAQAAEAERKSYLSDIRAAQAAILSNEAPLARLSLDSAPPGLRGWEWRHLDWTLSRGSRRLSDPVPDGMAFFTVGGGDVFVGAQDVVRVHPESGERELLITRPDRRRIRSIGASPDGKYLVIANALPPGTTTAVLELWDVAGRKLVREWDSAAGTPYFLAGRVVIVSRPGSAQSVTDAFSGELVGTMSGQEVTFLADGPGGDGRRYIMDQVKQSFVEVPVATKHWDRPRYTFYVSPDGAFTLSPLEGRLAMDVLRLSDGSRAGTVSAGGEITACAFHPRRRELAMATANGQVEVWDLVTFTRRVVLPVRGISRQLYYSSDGRALLAMEQDGSVRAWDADSSSSPHSIHLAPALAMSADATRVVCRYWGPVRCWNTESGALNWTTFIGQGYANCGAFSPDGTLLALGLLSRVVVLDASTGKIILKSDAFETSRLLSIAFSPDGGSLFVGCGDGTLVRLDASDRWRTPRKMATRHMSPVVAIQVSPDGRYVASASGEGKTLDDIIIFPGGDDASVRLWDAATGAEVRVMGRRPPRVNALKFSGDGRELYGAGMDGKLVAWSVPDGAALWELSLSDTGLSSVDLSPDGGKFVVGEVLGSVQVVDRVTRTAVMLPRATPGYCHLARFTPDGRTLVASAGQNLTRYETGVPDCGPAVRERIRRARSVLNTLPTDKIMEERLAVALSLVADDPQEAADVEQLVRTDGDLPSYLINSAILTAMDRGAGLLTYQRSALLARRCAEVVPDSQYYQDTLALALLRCNKPAEARAASDASEALDTPDSSPAMHHFVRALILQSQGDAAGAKRSLDRGRALMSAPMNAEFAVNRDLLVEASAAVEKQGGQK